MSREIKFRAWDKGHKKMSYRVNLYSLATDGKLNKAQIDTKQVMNTIGFDCEVMQYTGLKDKNGKEAFEKDYDDDGNMIDWCDSCCGYQFFQIDVPTKDIVCCHNCEGNFMLQDHILDFEIVGNLFEGTKTN